MNPNWGVAGGDMSKNMIRGFNFVRSAVLVGLMSWAVPSVAQQVANPAEPSSSSSDTASLNDSVRELREEVRELQSAVVNIRSDWQRAHAETLALRRELDEIRSAEVHAGPGLQDRAQSGGIPQNEKQEEENQKKIEHAASLDEEYQLLAGKVDDQYQTKVESASRYRLRISGIVLMNAFGNRGTVDSIDLPTLAYARPAGDSGGSVGATLRQSEIGFETFGPDVAGAKTKADLQLDLAGGFAEVPNGINSGLIRLRIATMRMDWADTSVVVGQDGLFFSPNSPTSFASLAIPALTYAGNLWNWVPQIRLEHRVALGDQSHVIFQGGILDPLTGETPASGYYRQPGPGEASRQPAYGTRVAWTRNAFGQLLQVGVGGYYSRQDYGFNRNVDGWAGMTDIELPISHQFTLSGKFYRGRALGGLYGGIGRSVLFSGDPTLPNTKIEALDSIGGWGQLKYRPANKWEFNAAFGIDNPYASDLKYFPYAEAYGDPTLARNQGSFVNVIYRPRSDLLFSAEYRHLTTYSLTTGGNTAGQLNLMMGVLF
jgi:hypothetical protein